MDRSFHKYRHHCLVDLTLTDPTVDDSRGRSRAAFRLASNRVWAWPEQSDTPTRRLDLTAHVSAGEERAPVGFQPDGRYGISTQGAMQSTTRLDGLQAAQRRYLGPAPRHVFRHITLRSMAGVGRSAEAGMRELREEPDGLAGSDDVERSLCEQHRAGDGLETGRDVRPDGPGEQSPEVGAAQTVDQSVGFIETVQGRARRPLSNARGR